MMEAHLKRYFWVLKLTLMSVVAFSASGVVNQAIMREATKALDVLVPTTNKTIKTKPVKLAPRQAWAQQIQTRNLFNAHPPGPSQDTDIATGGAEGGSEDPTGDLPGPYDECEENKGGVTLKLTMVAEPASSSYAIVMMGGDDRIVREGDILKDLKIEAIQWNGEGGRVVLSEEGKYSCLMLGKKAPQSRITSSPSRSQAKRTPPKSDKFKEGIKEIAPGRYEVDRAMLDEQIADLDNIMRQARVIPHYRQGKPVGFKVVGIRSNSIFRHLGLKSGDVLKSVGGEELTSINKAFGLFEQLKSSSNVTLDIERLGKVQNFEYNIK